MCTAEGTVSKLVGFFVFLGLVIFLGTFLSPWTAQYEVKTAAKTACNELILEKRGFAGVKWEDNFVRRARMAGVSLKPTQYAFKAEEFVTENLWKCNYKVAWKSSTPVFLLGDFFPDIPPLTLTHRLDDFHNVSRSY